jgi:NTE family protein
MLVVSMLSTSTPCGPPRPARLAVVLAGGAARGAYEVGVLRYLCEDVARALGREVPIDILCGTSVGAINVCALAAHADQPSERAAIAARAWLSLRIEHVVKPDPREMFQMLRGAIGRPPPIKPSETRRGGMLDPSGLERVITKHVPFEKIRDHVRAGRLHALSLSATHVASGRTIVFVEREGGGVPAWGNDPTTAARAVEIRAEHALASAAIPFLFPAVRLDGRFYSDGGLRQNVPLSPARRLGADGLIVVNPRRLPGNGNDADTLGNELAFPGPIFLLGKTLNALLLDRIDSDIDRLERINKLLDAGVRVWGDCFLDDINRAMGTSRERGLRPLRAVLVRASEDIGCLAADFVRSPKFPSRARGLVGRLLRRLAEGEARHEADFLSYLLFDGEFAGQLIELGRADARRHHDALCALVEARLGPPAEADAAGARATR